MHGENLKLYDTISNAVILKHLFICLLICRFFNDTFNDSNLKFQIKFYTVV